MIECKNLNYQYEKKDDSFKLEDINLQVKEGYFTCLVGHNGAGKTTLLKLLYGMLMPESGEVLFEGDKITGAEERAEYHKHTAYVGEDWCVPFLTVKENADTLAVLYPDFDWKLFDELLKRFDFDAMDSLYFKLSSGQKMKFNLCFQLARRPDYVILDEPLANLDVVAKQDIIEVLQQGIGEWNMGVLMSTHLLDEVSDIVDYIAVIEGGRLEEYGDRHEMFEKHNTDTLKDVARRT